MISKAQHELFLVLDDQSILDLEQNLVSTWSRGVQIGALLTGSGKLNSSDVVYHPPEESEQQGLKNLLVIIVDGQECLIASTLYDSPATITHNSNLVFIARQFLWMELFTQRLLRSVDIKEMTFLSEQDRQFFYKLLE